MLSLITLESSHQVLAEINNGQVTREWRDIAFHLKVSKTKIYEIETQARTQNCTLQWILISVVEEWMRGCEEPTWEQLANALERAGISQMAYTIRQKYTVNDQQARVQSDNSGKLLLITLCLLLWDCNFCSWSTSDGHIGSRGPCFVVPYRKSRV